MARVLVAGGSGLIGRALVLELMRRGDDVSVLTRAESGSREGVHYQHWDPSDLANARYSGEYDAIVNLAGEQAVGVRYSAATKDRILKSRVDSTTWLVRAMARAEPAPRVFVAGSAIGYYGSNSSSARVDESAPAGADFLALVCIAWEGAAERAAASGVRVVRARTGIVLSPQGGALESMARPFKLFVGGPIGSGEQGLSWIHLEDEVRALIFCVDREDVRGPVNLCAPAPISNAEASRIIGQVLHRPSAFRAPALALKALFGEGAEPLLGGQWGVPRVLEQAGFTFRYTDARAAFEAALRS